MDEGEKQAVQERFDAVVDRANAKLAGVSETDIQRRNDADIFGLKAETDEDEV